MANSKHRDSLVWGLILVVLGLLFLLDNLDLNVDVWHILSNFWPVVLIAWGAWKLFLGLKEKEEAREPEAQPAKVKK